MGSLATILATKPGRIYPGHGPVVQDGAGKIQEYLDHRNQREAQIVALLRKQGAGTSTAAIVAALYPHIPPEVVPSAARNVEQHLDKIRQEGLLGAAL